MKVKFIDETKLPRIIFTQHAFYTMFAAAHSKSTNGKEIMWLGEVVRDRVNDIFRVEAIHIPPQAKNSTVYVETDDEKFPEWVAVNFPDIPRRKSLRLHGHLHPNFSTNPSGTDENLFQQLLKNISDFYLRIIVNKSYEYTLDLFDKERNMIFNECTLEVELIPNILYAVSQPNGKYQVKMVDGIHLSAIPYNVENNNLVFNFTNDVKFVKGIFDKTMELHTPLLQYKDDKLYIKGTNAQIDKTLETMIKAPFYSYGYNYTSEPSSGFYTEGEGFYFTKGAYGYEPVPKKRGRPKKHKETSNEATLLAYFDQICAKHPKNITQMEKEVLIEYGLADAEDFEAAEYLDLTLDELKPSDVKTYLTKKASGKL